MSWQQYPQPVPYTVAPVMVTDQEQPNTGLVVTAWILVVFTGFYMLPWAIAATRGKRDQVGILLINLLLGWTIIGWIVALVLSLMSHRPIAVATMPMAAVPAISPVPGWYPNPNGPGQRYWNGRAWTDHLA